MEEKHIVKICQRIDLKRWTKPRGTLALLVFVVLKSGGTRSQWLRLNKWWSNFHFFWFALCCFVLCTNWGELSIHQWNGIETPPIFQRKLPGLNRSSGSASPGVPETRKSSSLAAQKDRNVILPLSISVRFYCLIFLKSYHRQILRLSFWVNWFSTHAPKGWNLEHISDIGCMIGHSHNKWWFSRIGVSQIIHF